MGRPGAFAPLKRWGGLAGPRARFFGSRPPGWGSGGLGQPGGRWRVLAAIGSGGRKFLGGAGGGPAAVSSSARRQSRLPHMGLRPRQVRELAEKSRRRWGGTKIHVCRICGTRKCMGSRGKEILDLTSKAKGVFKETGKGKPIYKGPPQTLRPLSLSPHPPPPYLRLAHAGSYVVVFAVVSSAKKAPGWHNTDFWGFFRHAILAAGIGL